jgi:hypothetical protein
MTNEQINIAIAEACGWTDCEYVKSLGLCKGRNSHLVPQYETGHSIIPNYAGCLNAMHEAEKMLTPEQECKYLTTLCLEVQTVPSLFNATARQRAEAFLRTLGKWEEPK